MKLLYLTHTVAWTGGGIFFTAYHQGRYLTRKGHHVTLACISRKSRFRIHESISEGVRIVEFPDLLWGKARSGWDIWDSLLRIVRFIGNDFDIIHGYESRPVVSLPGLLLSKIGRRPLFFTWADWFGRGGKGQGRGRKIGKLAAPLETFFEDHIYPKADYCIAMGEPLADRAKSLGIPKGKIGVLLHGCDPERIQPLLKDEARRSIPGLSEETVALGYLGVLRPENAELLFHSFRRIGSKMNRPCRLILIGNTKLNWRPYVPYVYGSEIQETGWLSYKEINNYLSACDLLLLPLRKEIWTDNVWPSKINDYLSAGRPIVSTKINVLEPLFSKNNIGKLCADNPVEFADSCLSLLHDPVSQRAMSVNARLLAEGELSWKTIVSTLEQYYLRILEI